MRLEILSKSGMIISQCKATLANVIWEVLSTDMERDGSHSGLSVCSFIAGHSYMREGITKCNLFFARVEHQKKLVKRIQLLPERFLSVWRELSESE